MSLVDDFFQRVPLTLHFLFTIKRFNEQQSVHLKLLKVLPSFSADTNPAAATSVKGCHQDFLRGWQNYKKNSLKENFSMFYMLHLWELGDTVSQVTDECSSNLYLRIITSGPQMAIIWWSMSLMNVHNNVTVCHLMLGRSVVQ